MKLEQLHDFIALAKHLSYTNAAKELYQSQPNLSMRISSMEKDLGCSLFDRNNSAVNLTPAGAVFLDYAQKIVNTYEEARAACTKAVRELKMNANLGARYYEALLRIEDIPIVFVDLDLEEPFLKALRAGVVDCGICCDYESVSEHPADDRFNGITFTSIGSSSLAICMEKTHPLASKTTLSRSDLKGATVIIFSGNHFDDWKRIVQKTIGDDIELRFHLHPVKSLYNLAFVDLDEMIYICSAESARTYLSPRDDVVFYETLDNEELLVSSAFVHLADNAAAANLACALKEELDRD